MIALSTFVVQASPQQKLYSGWSETSKRGVTHVTAGRQSSRMCRTRSSTGKQCCAHRSGSPRTCEIAEYAFQM